MAKDRICSGTNDTASDCDRVPPAITRSVPMEAARNGTVAVFGGEIRT